MLIELGNVQPHHAPGGETVALEGPAVTSFSVSDIQNEDGSYKVGFTVGTSAIDVLREFALRKGAVMHFGGNELIHQVINDWDLHSTVSPSWVGVEAQDRDPANAADIQRFFSEYWDCASGKPADCEDTHYTQYGSQVFVPGEKPEEN